MISNSSDGDDMGSSEEGIQAEVEEVDVEVEVDDAGPVEFEVAAAADGRADDAEAAEEEAEVRGLLAGVVRLSERVDAAANGEVGTVNGDLAGDGRPRGEVGEVLLLLATGDGADLVRGVLSGCLRAGSTVVLRLLLMGMSVSSSPSFPPSSFSFSSSSLLSGAFSLPFAFWRAIFSFSISLRVSLSARLSCSAAALFISTASNSRLMAEAAAAASAAFLFLAAAAGGVNSSMENSQSSAPSSSPLLPSSCSMI